MDTDRLMQIALDMVGMESVPADSAIYVPGDDIHRVLVGIDIGVAELGLASAQGFDAVIAHHPAGGAAVANFHKILERHVQQMTAAGVPEPVARQAIARLSEAREVAAHAANLDHVPSFARLLDMPFLNIHNPLDELGRRWMQEVIAAQVTATSTVKDVVTALNSLPEIAKAPTKVEVRLGCEDNPAGKVVVSHGAGTNGGYEVTRAYFEHGVSTLIYIHIGYDQLERLRRDFPNKNLIISGHIASDLLGIWPYVERLREEGLEVVTVSGIN